nr:hypothetical protein [Klebsiella pneumoniae subsp. pneumoniae]
MSRAADGSLRDALSLTDQAIASGEGRLTAASVSTMLGTLDDDQALSLIEALVAADGERVMAGVNDAAARGVEWEALLVEMQPAAPHRHGSAVAFGAGRRHGRGRSADARTGANRTARRRSALLPNAADWPQELPYAPDRRMGVEMTLLRAAAFHPRKPLPEPEVQPAQAAAPAPRQPVAPAAPPPQSPQSLPPTTSQVLAARSHLQRSRGATTPKVNRQPLPRAAGE